MLRPATPLAILLFAAFGLLLISVLSTPIIKAIPLGTFKGYNFGVFGFCYEDDCTPIEIGYDTSKIPESPTNPADGFDLPASARTTLSTILIIHPVAAFVTLVMLIMAVVSHFRSPSHSARYLLFVFIVGIVDFFVCLLAFLVDVLLFVPHLAFGSYLVLAATILVALSGIVACAMRRTLVSRKARKKRIAENAEMSGENFYNRQAQTHTSVGAGAMQPTVPSVSGANGTGNLPPSFTTFENKNDDRSSDERIPLTARSPSERSPNHAANDLAQADAASFNTALSRSGSTPSVNQRDQYATALSAPPPGYGNARGNSRGRGGAPPPSFRGRGGYGRGGYPGPQGPPSNGRGGYGPPPRGGAYAPPRGGGYAPPRGGYGMVRGGRTPPPGYANGPYDRRPSPAQSYGPGPYGVRQPSPGPPSAPGYGMNTPAHSAVYQAYQPEPDRNSLPRAESPPPLPDMDNLPIGQAVEMDERTGSPQGPPSGFGQFGQIRDSDVDVAGMVGLQQAKAGTNRHDTLMSDGSHYSQDENYIPPRQAWNEKNSRVPSPLSLPNPGNGANNSRSPLPAAAPAADGYYEDIDPRFAEPPSRTVIAPPEPYDSIPDGARSPAESEKSNFTSISQRGINPRWHPPPPPPFAGGGYGAPVPRRAVPNRNDMLLNANPDFELPAASRSRPGGSPTRNGPGMLPGSAYPTGPL